MKVPKFHKRGRGIWFPHIVDDEKKEVYPDKDRLKTDLKNKMPGVPKPAILRPVASLRYSYRTRLR